MDLDGESNVSKQELNMALLPGDLHSTNLAAFWQTDTSISLEISSIVEPSAALENCPILDLTDLLICFGLIFVCLLKFWICVRCSDMVCICALTGISYPYPSSPLNYILSSISPLHFKPPSSPGILSYTLLNPSSNSLTSLSLNFSPCFLYTNLLSNSAPIFILSCGV